MGYLLLFAALIGVFIYFKLRSKARAKSNLLQKTSYVIDKLEEFVTRTKEYILRTNAKLPDDQFVSVCLYLTSASDVVSEKIGISKNDLHIVRTLILRMTGLDLNTAREMVEGNESLRASFVNSTGSCEIEQYGRNAFIEWEKNGADSIEPSIDAFLSYVDSISKIPIEFPLHPLTFEEYYAEYIEEIKRLDPDLVQDGLHWIELTDDAGARRAFEDGISPKVLAKDVHENVINSRHRV